MFSVVALPQMSKINNIINQSKNRKVPILVLTSFFPEF